MNYNLDQGWYLISDSVITVDWKIKEGDKVVLKVVRDARTPRLLVLNLAKAKTGDAAALAGLIRRHLDDEEFRRAKAQQQHDRFAENFTLEHFRQRICDLLARELVAGGAK